MKLEKELVDTLRILDEYFKKHDIKYVLIGAQVPKILLSLDRNPDSRPTKDIDLALEFDSWDDYSKVITDLIELCFIKKVMSRSTSYFIMERWLICCPIYQMISSMVT